MFSFFGNSSKSKIMERKLLLTGSASFAFKKEFLNTLFDIDIREQDELDSIKSYNLDNQKLLIVFIELNTEKHDELKKQFRQYVNQVDAILLVEQLEPRPTTLISDLKKLNKSLASNLKINSKKIQILFYKNENENINGPAQYYTQSINFFDLKEELLKMDEMFKQLNIVEIVDQITFVYKQCYLWNDIKLTMSNKGKKELVDKFFKMELLENEQNETTKRPNDIEMENSFEKIPRTKFEDTKKSLVLVGPMYHGKSSLGNIIIGRPFTFDVGVRIEVSKYVQTNHNNDFTIIDCAGFEYDQQKVTDELISTINSCVQSSSSQIIDAILFVIEFYESSSHKFIQSLRNFIKWFGSEALDSTIFVCIPRSQQSSISNESFEKIIKDHSASKYLKETYGKEIKFIIWRDKQDDNANQLDTLKTEINQLQSKFTFKQLITNLKI